MRRVYVPEGETPIANVNWRYEWLWLYAFVHPQSGQTYYWILPYVNTELRMKSRRGFLGVRFTKQFNRVLADVAQEFGLGANKRFLIVLDQAGWHTSKNLIIPDGIHLLHLPSHSPELQPAERLWTLTNEPIANRTFDSLDELEAVLYSRCEYLLTQPEQIRGLTNFHWWPQTSSLSSPIART